MMDPTTPPRRQPLEEPPDGATTDDLTELQKRRADDRESLDAGTTHEVIRREGERELERSSPALFWSGLGCGLAIGFSLVVEGLLRHHLPDAEWRPLIAKLGYTAGFVLVMLANQELFTTNTLTPVVPLLTRRDRRTARQVMRLWAVLLVANTLGTMAIAWILANTALFTGDLRGTFAEIGREASAHGFAVTFLKALFAGWLVALLVWMLPASGELKVVVIVVVTYMIALGGFAHLIAGSVEVFYLVAAGEAGIGRYFEWYLPALLGNVIAGVALVAGLNHAQVTAGRKRHQPPIAESD